MGESETMRVIRAWLNGVRLCFNCCARTTSTRIVIGTDFFGTTGDRVSGAPAETTNILMVRALRFIQLRIMGRMAWEIQMYFNK